MRHAEGAWPRLAGVLLGLLAGLPALAVAAACTRPVYLTFDTGHMGVAPLVAQVLRDADVKATFFLANERTQTGGWSLDEQWAPWWRGMTAAGHAFGSHTWDHHTWLADRPDCGYYTRPSMGPNAGKRQVLSAAAYCAELQRPADRFQAITGQAMLSLFRAPGGKTSPALLQAARGCGWQHVGWAPAGFLGDELPSDRYPNDRLLKKALAGSASIALNDGAIKGINLAEALRKAKAAIGSKSAQEQTASGGDKTDFTEMTASFSISKGVAHNEDLSAKSPFIRIGGAGDLDIGEGRMNYLAKAAIVNTAAGQGGKDAGSLAGLTVPVRIRRLSSAPWQPVTSDTARSKAT
jgi:peptidoglycan/xylan/chitin deacetylase (PgdA/CDA1 family)